MIGSVSAKLVLITLACLVQMKLALATYVMVSNASSHLIVLLTIAASTLALHVMEQAATLLAYALLILTAQPTILVFLVSVSI